ncbi:Sodium/calcium exchanger protein-domain-containing protein [Phascolomyces articulosus]|uniref:Sodium/calcium exchanger protein-domain-containing protein n=1 Tax=Phascolomyces articulosus TaxID=60185 RepID=A0AAD5KCB0_9FUNG|nr:Sodium/calcium exchanger protein-domain-containing protein [Phascolomyces articulosus]
MVSRNTALLLSLVAIIKIASWSWQDAHSINTHLSKRAFDDLTQQQQTNECDNIHLHEDQCAFVLEHCADTTPGIVNYINWYYCASGAARPVILVILCAWLLFLFGFVGIAASDFFCPNLQTIASALHLSESLTGVTFLAFGNGSPDLFSTFSAMHSNMGSLALGELVGAAAFIVSVVAGSMCAIKPFRTKKLSFLRDVSFFTLAIILVMGIVADGLIYLYEAIILILFYVVYVVVVVGGNYYTKRRSNYQNLVERARLEYEETGPEVDNLLRGLNAWDDEGTQDDEMELYDEGFETEGYHSEYVRGRRTDHPKLRIKPSLFSAIEFQDVVRSLQQSNTRSTGRNGLFRRHHPHQREISAQSDGSITQNVPLSPRGATAPSVSSETQDNNNTNNTYPFPSSRIGRRLRLPIEKLGIDFQDLAFHLFPSLVNFSDKAIYSKISSVISAPVIFVLAITLPVVKEDAIQKQGRGEGNVVLDDDALAMLQDIPDNDHRHSLEMNELSESTSVWSQWMTATQLFCAPVFVAVVFAINGFANPAILIPVAAAFGLITTVAFKLTTTPSRQPRLYWMMSFVGFGIAMVWIFLIANEVVSVLQVIGMALGISDAILGLTVFALGNSLGDLVANVTMARMGYPMMAMSACFGGPMLNIMLGVGIGATYVTSQRNEPYPIELSKTILVSAIGLLVVLVSLLILVPLNKYRMSRVFGCGSIVIYLLCTAINLYIEITS